MKKTRSISRSRLGSRLRAFALTLLLGAAPVYAQQVPILTIDQDRLFAETRLGGETLAKLEAQAKELAAENEKIEAELIAEEGELTEIRGTLPAEEFRALADEFDQRVQQIRGQQDEKARDLNRQRDEARSVFFNEVAEILSEIVREKGALIVVDRRDVFLSADRIDITDEAIERVNEAGTSQE